MDTSTATFPSTKPSAPNLIVVPKLQHPSRVVPVLANFLDRKLETRTDKTSRESHYAKAAPTHLGLRTKGGTGPPASGGPKQIFDD